MTAKVNKPIQQNIRKNEKQITEKQVTTLNQKLSQRKKKQQTTRDFDTHWKASLEDYVTALAWSTDGNALGSALAAGAASGEVLLWTGAQTVFLRSAASEQAISTLGFSADGRYLAAAGQQGAVFIWDLTGLLTGIEITGLETTQQPVVVLENPSCWIDRLVWHPTEPYLAFGAGTQLKVWDIPKEKLLCDRSFISSSVLDLAWHPDGQFLAVSGHTGVKVWRTDNWETPPEFVEVPGASLRIAWSADGQYLASGNLDRTLTVVDWGNPPPWLMQGFPGKVRQVAWAAPAEDKPFGGPPMVAAACAEGITVWRRQGKQWQSQVLKKHKGTVEAISFHPTAPLLASASQDGRLCLWKQATSLQQTLRGVKARFSAIAWHPKGNYLAAGGSQGEIIVWTPSSRGAGFQR